MRQQRKSLEDELVVVRLDDGRPLALKEKKHDASVQSSVFKFGSVYQTRGAWFLTRKLTNGDMAIL